MKRTPLLILLLFLILSVFSCGNKSEKGTQKVDTVWNDKVQDTFFGLRLGDSIGYNEAVLALYNNGFIQSEYSNETCMSLLPRNSKTFSFGGLSWEMMNIYMVNDVFCGIEFYNASLDKASALENYNVIRNVVSSKYRLTEFNLKDTTVYAVTGVAGKNNVFAEIRCYRYESLSRKILIGTHLSYFLYKRNIVNTEL